MDTKSTKDDVESRLEETAEAMSDRLSSLQEEVSTTGDSVREWIVRNPVKSIGGMLAAGLAVGLIFGGSRSNRRRRHAELIDTYLNALRDEVEQAVDRGEAPGPALEKALQDRVPLMIYSDAEETDRATGEGVGWLLREGASVVFTTGLSLLAQEVIESLLARVDVAEIVEEEFLE